MGQIIPCSFNLFQEGRKYTGHHRNYILESAIKTCYAPETREGLKLREKLGYLGHGRREIARKLALSEVETVKLPDGSTIITENIPSNVTVAFEVGKDGSVTHSQELLDTEPGKAVSALNSSRVGGFSWACGGADGGPMAATKITAFQGFDYVMNPGFSANRGYILENADGASRDMILESICKLGVSDGNAETLLSHWVASAQIQAIELEDRLEQAAIYEDALREQMELKNRELQQTAELLSKEQNASESRKKLITECAAKSVIVVPANVLDSMISMACEDDFNKIVAFYESANRVSLSGLPIGENHKTHTVKSHTGAAATKEVVEFGTAQAACDFETTGILP